MIDMNLPCYSGGRDAEAIPSASRISQLAAYPAMSRITTKTDFFVKKDNFLTFAHSRHGRLFRRSAQASSEKPSDPA
jgi:hypothetical protein